MVYRVAVLDDMAAELRRTEEMLSAYGAAHPEQELGNSLLYKGKSIYGQHVPDRDSVPEERQIYGHSVWFLIDTLRTKWNSRKNG